MMSRLITVAVVLFWLTSMGWLISHDVVPAWTARDVPRISQADNLNPRILRSQARIEDKNSHRIGTVWTEYTPRENAISRSDVVWLERFSIAPRMRIEIDTTFTAEGSLDELTLNVFGVGERVRLTSENFSGHLAFELTLGSRKPQRFKVDASVGGMVGDVFQPFGVLPGIEVGQSWRLHVINPLAAMTGVGAKLIPMLVRVTRRDRILTEDGAVDCFVVETDRVRAWVDDQGIVLRQEMDLPVGGTLSVVAEPFDESKRDEVLRIELPSGSLGR